MEPQHMSFPISSFRTAVSTFLFILLGVIIVFATSCDKPDQEYEEAIMCYKNQAYDEAVVLFAKAASRGHIKSQFSLGECYRLGKGVASNINFAIVWYRRAADQGNANALYNIGWMYGNGRGVAKDDAEAVKWYKLAVK